VTLCIPRLKRLKPRSSRNQHFVEVLVKIMRKSAECQEGTRSHLKEKSENVRNIKTKSMVSKRTREVI